LIKLSTIIVLNNIGLEHVVVTFSCEDTIEDLSLYRFDISRSESPEGPFTSIVSDVNAFEYLDETVNLYRPAVQYYYQITK
jgi:hypothetical protein